MNIKLVEDWRQAWRWFSVQAMGVATAFLAVWAVFPDDLKAVLPAGWTKAIAIAVLLIGLVGRLVQQPKK